MHNPTLTINIDDAADTMWLLAKAVAEGQITVTKQTPNPNGTLTIEWNRTK